MENAHNIKKILIILLTLLLTGACATTTNLDTIKNMQFDNVTYERILIVAPFKDIGIRRQTEYEFIGQLILTSAIGILSLDLIPPLKEYTSSEMNEVLDKNDIDAILVIAFEDYWTKETYVPKTTSTNATATWYGNSLQYESYSKEFGGYYISQPRISFELRLYDKESGEVAWMTTTFTKGSALDDYKNLCNSLAKETIKKLIEENLISN